MGTAMVVIPLDPLLMSVPVLISSDLLTSHLSNVTFNLVQQRLTEPHNLPPNVRCIQTLAKWSQVSEFSFTITDQLSSTVRSVNWSAIVIPPPLVK